MQVFAAPSLPFAARPLAQAIRLALLCSALAHVGASAQTATAAPDRDEALRPQPGEVAHLPAITVSGEAAGRGSYTIEAMNTATGLSLSPRETPQTVSVVTRQEIEDEGLTDAAAILMSAPGISASRSDSNRWSFSSRGFAIDSFQFDGLSSPIISQWNYGATDMDSAIYENVEIVRGATGLMSGAGTPSAAVNFIRKRPLPEFTASASLSASRWNTVRGTVDVSTPLTHDGRIRSRWVAAASRGDSYVSYLDSRKQTVYGVVTADLTPNTQLTTSVEHQRNRSHGFGSGFPLFYSNGSRTDFDRAVSNNTPWSNFDTRSTTFFADLTHRFDNEWQARAAYSHSSGRYLMKQIFRGGYPDAVTGLGMSSSFSNYDGKRWRNEVHLSLTGPFNLLGRRHELSVGWMSVNDHSDIQQYALVGARPAVGSYFNWANSTVAEPTWSDQLTPADDLRRKQNGAYLVGRFSLADPLHLILGGRLSNWETDQVYFGAARQYKIRREFTPYAGLVYDINEQYSAYASYTDIFQPQNARTPSGDLLEPVTGKSYEVGVKAAWFGGRLNGALALFQTRQDNLAQAIPGATVIGMPNVQAYEAGRGAKVQGVDLQAAGQLAAGWNVTASLTHFTAKDANGNPVSTSQPRSLFKFYTTYRLPGAWNPLTVGGGVDWQSRIFSNAASPLGTVEVGQGSYALVNLMARYQFNRTLSATLNVNNLFDKQYYQQIGFYSQGWWGEPRNVMLTLRAQY